VASASLQLVPSALDQFVPRVWEVEVPVVRVRPPECA
jgi:hypothetical protein